MDASILLRSRPRGREQNALPGVTAGVLGGQISQTLR